MGYCTIAPYCKTALFTMPGILVGRKGNVDVEGRSVGKIIADSRRHLSKHDLLTIFELLMSDYYVMKIH